MKPLFFLIGGTTVLLAIGSSFRSDVPAPEEAAPMTSSAGSGPGPLINLEPAPLLAQSERPAISPPPPVASLAPLLRAARVAVEAQPGSRSGPDILVRGLVQAPSGTSRFHLMFNSRGCYLQEIEGPVTVTTGFDGHTGWELATTRRQLRPMSSELALPDPVIAVLTGHWLAPNGRYSLSVSPEGTTGSQVTVHMQARGSDTTCLVQFRRSDWLPYQLTLRAPDRTESWRLDDYRTVLGRKVPHRLTRLRPSGRELFRVQSVVRVRKLAPDLYQATHRRMAELAVDGQKPG